MDLQELSSYIVCRKDCTLKFLEALSMNGFAVKARVEDCDRPRFKKIKLQLIDGSEVESTCRFDEEVRQSLRIINIYIGFARRNNAPEKLSIVEGKPEE
jgi:hypothetical protein